MALNMNYVRDQFPGLKSEWAFMDNAGGSQILKGCVDKITDYYYSNNVQLGGSYQVSQDALKAFTNGRENIATFFNAAKPEEIVFGPSTTVLLQFLSKSMASQFRAGDEVIVTITDHESNIGPWVWLEERGVRIKFWPMNKETYELELEALDALMTEKTKLVAFTHVSNLLGTINDVKKITEFVHERSALVCIDTYFSEFEGFYLTGDAGHKDEDGYLYIMGRTDDVINVAGHRLSTGSMEEVLANLPEVAECAVVGVQDDLKGQVPYGFLVLKNNVLKPHDEIINEAVKAIRQEIGAVASFKTAVIVKRLPKTRSGKILRRVMSSIAGKEEYSIPATLDDPIILNEISEALFG